MTKIGLRKIILRIAKTTSKSLFIVSQDMLRKSRVLLPLHKKTACNQEQKENIDVLSLYCSVFRL